MPVGAIAGASVVGGGISAFGANKAAKTQAAAADRAMQMQLGMYNQSRADMQPYMNAGRGAVTSLAQLYGIDGDGNATGQPFNPEALEKFRQSPDYAFAENEGRRQVQFSAAAQGGLRGGNHMRDLTSFGQGLASQQFGNYFNRLLQLSQIGSGAATNSASIGANVANGAGQMQLASGAANASGIVGMANAANGAIGQGTSNLMLYNLMNNKSSYQPSAAPGVGMSGQLGSWPAG